MRIFSALILLILFSCSNQEGLVGFAKESWQADKMGCEAERSQLIDELIARKLEITGLGQEDITAMLGKPDKHELYKRNKKSFTYYLANGPDCDHPAANPPMLVIRFDGLGRSKEIIHYKAMEE